MIPYHPLDRDKPLPPEEIVTTDDIYSMLAGNVTPSQFASEKRRAKQREIEEDERRWRRNNFKAYLDTLSTNELLQMLGDCRVRGYVTVGLVGEISCSKIMGGNFVTVEDIVREVLATRPHVPNKPEAKAIRRQKAKACHGKAKSKDR
jgi:hypothetical protein